MPKPAAVLSVVESALPSTAEAAAQQEPSSPPRVDPLVGPVRDVLALYDTDLAEVRFPDVDRSVLGAAARVVEAAADDVARLEAMLEEARRRLDDSHDAVVHICGRAVAYARIFAIGDDELMARLDAIILPRGRRGQAQPAQPTVTKKRGKKSAPSDTLFPGEAPVDGEAADAAQ